MTQPVSTDLSALTYAVGDVQGCEHALAMLIERVHADAREHGEREPFFVFVGDLVNRGPQSLATLRHMKALGERGAVVLGNHDLHLLAAAHHIRKPHPRDTLDEILSAPDRDELLDWLRRQPLALLRDDHLFVHAGVLPQWSAEQTLSLAQEVQQVLSGPDWIDFLTNMYGNQPDRWDDNLRGHDRLRCIVNALTRIRFCDRDGRMEFVSKEGAHSAPPGFMPWFDVPDRKTAGSTIVCGHWSTLGLVMRPDLIALDTGCVWGGSLTAVCLQDRGLVQIECPQYQQP